MERTCLLLFACMNLETLRVENLTISRGDRGTDAPQSTPAHCPDPRKEQRKEEDAPLYPTSRPIRHLPHISADCSVGWRRKPAAPIVSITIPKLNSGYCQKPRFSAEDHKSFPPQLSSRHRSVWGMNPTYKGGSCSRWWWGRMGWQIPRRQWRILTRIGWGWGFLGLFFYVMLITWKYPWLRGCLNWKVKLFLSVCVKTTAQYVCASAGIAFLSSVFFFFSDRSMENATKSYWMLLNCIECHWFVLNFSARDHFEQCCVFKLWRHDVMLQSPIIFRA